MESNMDSLTIVHIRILSLLYEEHKKDKDSMIVELEDGNQEHKEAINQLVDMGLIHVRPHKNTLRVFLTDQGLARMQVVERLNPLMDRLGT